MIVDIKQGVVFVGAVILFVIEGWALVDAVSHRPETYVAAEKQTKTMWLVLLGIALAAHLVFWHPISLLNMAGAVASIVYLVDVRPALRSLTRR